MGRNMFGGGPGPWGDDPWTGWWGDDPPYHTPVFVLTHHAREPLALQGGTTFPFVTDGIESRARAGQGGRRRQGCPSRPAAQAPSSSTWRPASSTSSTWPLCRSSSAAGRGSGEPRCADIELEQVRAVEAPGVTHLKYRVVQVSQARARVGTPLQWRPARMWRNW